MPNQNAGGLLHDEEIDTLLERARDLEEQADWAAAVRTYRAALALIPPDHPLHWEVEETIERLESPPDEPVPAWMPETEEPVHTPILLKGLLGCMGLIAIGLFALAGLLFWESRQPAVPQLGAALASPTPRTLASGIPKASPTPAPAPSLTRPPAPGPTTIVVATPLPNLSTLVAQGTLVKPSLVSPAAPSLTPVLAPGGSVLFQDQFQGAALDSKWIQDNTPGTTIQLSNGVLRLASTGAHMPYIHTRSNPFPSAGNFRVDVRFRYSQLGVCGAPVGMASFVLPAGLSQDQVSRQAQAGEANGISIWLWHGTVQYRAGPERTEVPLPGNASDWRVATIQYIGAKYYFSVDDSQIFVSQPTGARPQVLWLGHPAELGSNCAWDTLETSAVRVQSLP